MYPSRLEEIKEIHEKANRAYLRSKEMDACVSEDSVSDSLSELFYEEHTDWLIEQVNEFNNLKLQLSNLVDAIYEHVNEGTELMKIAERIDEMY